ncbi:enoyl-CoA hydratase [Flocculibacter collagenilyticus]|uniref:enoyl-CoA hydratase n=1 Tax=Flocculibacter collagenilyticus TaxID=2744479 RepID=UPI0018F47699|nr:enoyl-CoA hydratase [Flocculibacter collagenilyticus]
MTEKLITTTRENGVFTITMNRFEKKNALSLEMYRQLIHAYQTFEEDDSLLVAVVKGNHECFSAGNDLKDFLAGGDLNKSHPTIAFIYQMTRMTKPIIAAVAGPAVGIGTTMLLHCDLVYAAENAIFQLPFCQLGLCPEAGSSYLLSQLAGHQKAFELLVLGERFDAQTAKEIGLVANVMHVDNVIEAAENRAKQIVALPTDAVKRTKMLLNRGKYEKLQQVLDDEVAHFSDLLQSDDCQTILNKFFTKK